MSGDSIDLTEWHGKLVNTLTELDAIYRDQTEDAHDRQKTALAALATSVVAISELPGMKDRITPLFSLLFAYQALTDTGKSEPLLVNYVKTRGGRQLTMAAAVVQGRTVAFIEIMLEAGWSERESVQFVTDRLVEAGVKGRRGNAVTPSTVRSWRNNAKSGDFPEISKHVAAAVSNLRSSFSGTYGRWPPSKQEVQGIVGLIPQVQIFRDFATSAASSVSAE